MDAVESGATDRDGEPGGHHLNARQQRFVAEYLTDLNASAAYRRAGYRANGDAVSVNACRLLGNARVRAAIATAQKQRAVRLQLRADAVVQELARVAFADIGTVVEWGTEGDESFWAVGDGAKPFLRLRATDALLPEERAAIRKIRETRYGLSIEMHDKVGALVALARHFGLLDGAGKAETDESGVPRIPIETLRLLQQRNEELERKRREMGLSGGQA